MVTAINPGETAPPPTGGLRDVMLRADRVRVAVPLVTFVVALGFYLPTILPGVSFWDTAEFQTVGPVLGIAHPTGFPTYTLLTWLASVVLSPVGDAAYRVNLLSAILVAGAAAAMALAAYRVLSRPLLAAGAGFLLAATPIAWWTATRADAHALHLLLFAILLERLVAWAQAVQAGSERAHRPLLAASFVYGASLGNHGLTVLLAPGIAAFLLAVQPSIIRQGRLVLSCGAVIALTTVALYAYIPIRASMNPPLNYAHPSSLEGFFYLVGAAQFYGLLQDPFARGLGPIVDVFVVQVGWLPIGLGLLGLASLSAGTAGTGWLGPRLALLTGLWFVIATVFSAGYGDGFVDRYYLGPLAVLGLWAAVGVAALLDAAVAIARSLSATAAGASRTVTAGLSAVLVALFLAYPAWRAAEGWGANDASAMDDGSRWGTAALEALAPNAVVISWWSYSTNLWYHQHVLGLRRDILIADDRVRLDEDWGEIPETIDRFLGQGRPVYLIPAEGWIIDLGGRYELEPIRTIPGYSPIWRVVT